MTRRKDNKGRVLEKGESQRKDGLYMYRYQDVRGERKCIYDSNLSSLREKEKKINRDLEDGIDTEASHRTLNEQFDIYMETNARIKDSTRSHYEAIWSANVANSFLGCKEIGNIRRSDILRFCNELHENKGIKVSTINIYRNLVSSVFNMAVDDDIIRKNPCSNCAKLFADDSKKRDALSVEQQVILIDYVKSHHKYEIYFPLISFLLETGLRFGEIAGLTWKDVDFENKEITVDHQLTCYKLNGKREYHITSPKSKAGYRTIPLTNVALGAIRDQRVFQFSHGLRYYESIDGYSDFVFTNKKGNIINVSSFDATLDCIVNNINKESPDIYFPQISAHVLRHTACTRMSENGIDIKVLQYIMGHDDIRMTANLYNHVQKDRRRTEMEKINEVRSKEEAI